MVDPLPAPGTWTVYCDGSAMPNPGRMGLGAVLVAPDGTRHTLSQATRTVGCNNEAEVRAVMAALGEVHARGGQAVCVYCDNSVVVAQLGGGNARPIARLAAVFDAARGVLALFAEVEVRWLPGHRNGEADALARAALGVVEARAVKPRKGRRN
jgi:ribonuclease HI